MKTAEVVRTALDFPKLGAKLGATFAPEPQKPDGFNDAATTLDELKCKIAGAFTPIREMEQPTPSAFELRQIAVDGTEVDRFRITK